MFYPCISNVKGMEDVSGKARLQEVWHFRHEQKFPQSFQGSMGQSGPEARSAEGADDAQTPLK